MIITIYSPKVQTIFFDCDDCLYVDNWKTVNLLMAKIDQYCVERYGLPSGQAYELYKQYGMCLKGLLAEGMISSPDGIDEFLQALHDIPLELQCNEALGSMLAAMDPSIPKYIFTASVAEHAERCLQQLGIAQHFLRSRIIDCKQCDLETKHSAHALRAAMTIAGVTNPECCMLLDDNVHNIYAARMQGWRAVLVDTTGWDCGKPIALEHAELQIATILDVRDQRAHGQNHSRRHGTRNHEDMMEFLGPVFLHFHLESYAHHIDQTISLKNNDITFKKIL